MDLHLYLQFFLHVDFQLINETSVTQLFLHVVQLIFDHNRHIQLLIYSPKNVTIHQIFCVLTSKYHQVYNKVLKRREFFKRVFIYNLNIYQVYFLKQVKNQRKFNHFKEISLKKIRQKMFQFVAAYSLLGDFLKVCTVVLKTLHKYGMYSHAQNSTYGYYISPM